jgi:C-terminal processing protease CtpA/Prc
MQLPTSNGAGRALCVLCGALGLLACGPPTWPGGIHAQLGWSEQGVRVVEVPPDGPADRADLRPGDRIVRIDGVPIAGRDSAAVQRLLSGEVGSSATLEVLRDGRPLTLAVQREPYARNSEAR